MMKDSTHAWSKFGVQVIWKKAGKKSVKLSLDSPLSVLTGKVPALLKGGGRWNNCGVIVRLKPASN